MEHQQDPDGPMAEYAVLVLKRHAFAKFLSNPSAYDFDPNGLSFEQDAGAVYNCQPRVTDDWTLFRKSTGFGSGDRLAGDRHGKTVAISDAGPARMLPHSAFAFFE